MNQCALRFAYIFSKLLRKMTVRPFKYKSTYVAYSYYCFTFMLFLHFSLCFFFFTLYSFLLRIGVCFFFLSRYIYSIFQKIDHNNGVHLYKRCRHLKYELWVFLSHFCSFFFGFLYLVLRHFFLSSFDRSCFLFVVQKNA